MGTRHGGSALLTHDRSRDLGEADARVGMAQPADLVGREAAMEDHTRIDVGVHARARPAGVIQPQEVAQLVGRDVLHIEAPRIGRCRESVAAAVEEHVSV